MGHVTTASFFGGVGLRCRGTQFAVVMNGELYLSVDDESRRDLARLGGEAFAYSTSRGTVTVRAYHRLPAAVYEDPEQLVLWAVRAHRTALARRARRSAVRPRPRLHRSLVSGG
ncbi:TfoX/Sxy family protein [Nocardioides sp.]|uniref:TfoX/Sxy family protein n=1 Tax=Nocardioides sp. TaxID=35761 RepID=UPI0039C937A8